MFDALQLECVLHALGHREELAGIQRKVNKGKGHHKSLSLDIGNGMVDGMITRSTCKV